MLTSSFAASGATLLLRAMSKIGVEELTVSGHLMSQVPVMCDASFGFSLSLHSLAYLGLLPFVCDFIGFGPAISPRNLQRLGTSLLCAGHFRPDPSLPVPVPGSLGFPPLLRSVSRLDLFLVVCNGCQLGSLLLLQHFSRMGVSILLCGLSRAPCLKQLQTVSFATVTSCGSCGRDTASSTWDWMPTEVDSKLDTLRLASYSPCLC